ncbi:MAG TPA: hypothetical protein VEV38_01275 [Candidatus Eremiobacteraceae bacterium]|nr:hypothetical protein [Candidatus Eremiobacteraceae bacterium]
MVAALFSVVLTAGSLLLAPLDQNSTYAVVSNARPGARIDVYANGRDVGTAIAARGQTVVQLRSSIEPASVTIAVEQTRLGVWRSVAGRVLADVSTYHMNNLRTGWNQYEYALTQASVASAQFEQLMNLPVDGDVYAEPLFLRNEMIGGVAHDVLLVATENDSVYAFDAESGALLWMRNFTNASAGLTAMPSTFVSCHNVWPNVGITGTPVVERSLDAIFLVDKLYQSSPTGGYAYQELRKISLSTGMDLAGSPATIAATVLMSDGTPLSFDPRWALQRPGLLSSNGKVYMAFGTHCDNNHAGSHGWVMAYNETTMRQLNAFTTTRDPSDSYIAGIWMAGFGLSGDRQGSVYFSVGNGPIDVDQGGNNYGECVVKLSPLLAVQDFFCPHDAAILKDKEIGSGGVMLLPDQSAGVTHLAVLVGKNRTMYLMNRDDMGHYIPGGPDQIVQEIANAIGAPYIGTHGGPAYYANESGQFVFYAGHQDHIRAFRLNTSPTSLQLVDMSPDIYTGEGGSIPFVSSHGMRDGSAIVWAIKRPDDPLTQPLRLEAYDANDLSQQLVDIPAGPWFNPQGNPDITPTVVNGEVFVPTGNSVAVFGLAGSLRAHFRH